MIYTAVFDTNIWISAQLSPSGVPSHCVKLVAEGQVRCVICQEILDELQEKLQGKFNYPSEKTSRVITLIRQWSQVVTLSNMLHGVCPDPKDDMVLECAVIGKATHIVTGDRRHLLPLGEYEGIAIVSASDFLALFPALGALE